MLQADLKVLGGKFQGKLIPLNTKKFLVGREQDCHLRPNSDMVSRHHCIFLVDDYTVRLRDLGSTNGTRVNGELVRHEVVLNDGDKITIGKLELQLALGKAAPVAAAAPTGTPTGASDRPSGEFELPPARAASETTYEMPTAAAADMNATVANFTGDTAIHNPPQVPGYPGMVPGYGYPPAGAMPAYPPGYPMVFPGYPQPGYPAGYAPAPGYPPVMPGYPAPPTPVPPPAAATGSTVAAMPVRLPPPDETGVKTPTAAPSPPAAPVAGESTAAPPVKEAEKSSNSAADIIKQYMQRRGGK